MENDIPIPLDGNIQHHSAVNGICVLREKRQLVQLGIFQLRHKAHGADIYAQQRNPPAGCRLGGVQNRTVAAKADYQVRIGKLPLQSVEANVFGQFKALVHFKRKADSALNASVLQNLNRVPYRLEILIPVRIRS